MPDGPDRETMAILPDAPVGSKPAAATAEHWLAVEGHARRSGTGAFIFTAPGSSVIVAPPFPVQSNSRERGFSTRALRELLTKPYRVGAVLLRLGGYAIGVYEGDQLVHSRNDARFVKNRHRKGGQSQRRFDRIREKQIDLLYAQACNAALGRLTPHAAELDFLLFGGDRHTVQAFRKECVAIEALPVRVLSRFLTVPEPRHETLERLPALLSTGQVARWRRDSAPV